MDGIIGIAGVLAALLGLGGLIGALQRRSFSLRWLVAAAALVGLNDLLLTNGYGTFPALLPDGEWNWQGKVLALVATLGVAALPVFGWRACGITLRQRRDGWPLTLAVVAAYMGVFLILGLALPNEAVSAETLAFQLTLPGLEEEIFYRGLLLFALGRAFTARGRFLGVEWGMGAVLSSVLFGLAHAFGFSDGTFRFDLITMALTALPSLIAVWLALRTRSVLLPVLLHNFGNAITFMI